MSKPTIKAINFDLNTKAMQGLGVYPDGYRKIGSSFNKLGLEHRQGSGYVTKTKCVDADIVGIIKKVVKENPWLQICINKIDVTDVAKQYDLTSIVKNVNLQQSVKNQTQAGQQPSQALQAMRAGAKKYQSDKKALSKAQAKVKQSGNAQG